MIVWLFVVVKALLVVQFKALMPKAVDQAYNHGGRKRVRFYTKHTIYIVMVNAPAFYSIVAVQCFMYGTVRAYFAYIGFKDEGRGLVGLHNNYLRV